MASEIFGLLLALSLILPIVVFSHAKDSGRDPFFWAIIVFIANVPGLLLYVYDLHKDPFPSNNRTSMPSLQVSCVVVDPNTNEEKKMGLVINTNDMEEAKQRFRNSCVKKGLVLTEEPNVEIK